MKTAFLVLMLCITPSVWGVPAMAENFSIPFLANQGQAPEPVAFHTSTFCGTVFITRSGEIVYSLGSGPLREQLVAGTVRNPAGEDPHAARVNYFKGNDPSRWQSGIPCFGRVQLGEVYPGIHLELAAAAHNVEKLFLLSPGAQSELIRIRVNGAERLEVCPDGQLTLQLSRGRAAFTRPVAFQEIAGERRFVEVAYRVDGLDYGFELGDYDRTKPLVIDPLLAATYLGGTSGDGEFTSSTILVDGTDSVYVAGFTISTDFPFSAGAFDPDYNGGTDLFIARLSQDLSTLQAATFLGGTGTDLARRGPCLALDGQGSIYVSGQTTSTDFPVLAGAYDTTHNGNNDLFVARLSDDLSTLEKSTYLGAGGYETANGLAFNGSVYVSGYTRSILFPTVPGSYDQTYNGTGSVAWGGDLYVARLDADLTTLTASTFLGGTEWEDGGYLVLDSDGEVFVTGTTTSLDLPKIAGAYCQDYQGGPSYGGDAFAARFSGDLSSLTALTYLGGTGIDFSFDLILDPASDDLILTGHHSSTDFPTTANAYDLTYNGTSGYDTGDDLFISRLDNDLQTLIASTYVGGDNLEIGVGLGLDPQGNIYVGGSTNSSNYPVTPGAFDEDYNGGNKAYGGDLFITRMDPYLTEILASTFLGGSKNDHGSDLVIDGEGAVWLVGNSNSVDFPVTAGAFDPDFNGGGTWSGDVVIVRLDRYLGGALATDKGALSMATGGTVDFYLTAGDLYPGRDYLLLGGFTGMLPGTSLPGGTVGLPVNWDTLTDRIIALLNTPFFGDFYGVLDGNGEAIARLSTGPLPGHWLGRKLRFAFCLGSPFDFASNAVDLDVVP